MAEDKDKGKKIPRALFSGTLEIGDQSLPAYVLEDETRVFSTRGMLQSLGYKVNSNPNEVFNSNALKPYMLAHGDPYNDTSIISFKTDTGSRARGYDVEKFLDICSAISEAFDKGELSGRNAAAGLQANAILRATSKVGIIALIRRYEYESLDYSYRFFGWVSPPRRVNRMCNHLSFYICSTLKSRSRFSDMYDKLSVLFPCAIRERYRVVFVPDEQGSDIALFFA